MKKPITRYFTCEYWQDRAYLAGTLRVTRLAKRLYKRKYKGYNGMCAAFGEASHQLKYTCKVPREFNRVFLGGEDRLYWWPVTNTEARIVAFDKLIEIYKDKIKQL